MSLRVFTAAVLIASSLTASGAALVLSSDRLDNFQRFANCEIPIQEAVVYTKYSEGSDYTKHEWWRFGIQGESWYCERLEPADPLATNQVLISVRGWSNTVCGASFRELWAINDDVIHVADREHGLGSKPDSFGGMYRNPMMAAMSLGIARDLDPLVISNATIKWKGTNFSSIIGTKFKDGHISESAPVRGAVELGADGAPVSAIEWGNKRIVEPKRVTYEYGPDNRGIPRRVVVRYTSRRTEEPIEVVSEKVFLSLRLGYDERASVNGYLPGQFAQKNRDRLLSYWTNKTGYALYGNEFRQYVQRKPRVKGAVVLSVIALGTGAAAWLWYRRMSNKPTTKEVR